MPTPATEHEHPSRRAPKRPWRQFAQPAVLRLPFRIDTRSGPGRALLAFRRGIIKQLGGGDLTAIQVERIDNACLLKLQLLTADLTARDQATLSATLDRLLGSIERSADPVRRHERMERPAGAETLAALADATDG